MRCAEFRQLLPDLLRGGVLPAMHAACEAHLLECASCLESLAEASAGQWQHQDATAMLESIMQSISSEVCATSACLLCDSMDGTLNAEQSVLLLSHLEHCKVCQQLQRSLLALSADLPLLAQQQPPDALLATVLRSTTQKLPVSTSFLQRSLRQLDAVILRPRIALEAAFSITLVWTLIVGIPVATFDTVFAEQPALVQRLELPQVLSRAQAGLEQELVDLSSGITRPLMAMESQLTLSIHALQLTGREHWHSLTRRIDELTAGITSGFINDERKQ